MPWLPVYIDHSDLASITDWLNAEDCIAFIVSEGPKRWVAVPTLDAPPGDGYVGLWHTESGPLPLTRGRLLHALMIPDGRIRNPFKGWREQRTGADPTRPYFGAGHPGVYWFRVRTRAVHHEDGIGLSSFEWIGNRYRRIGHGAPEVTMKWWQRLRRWVKKQAVQIARSGRVDGPEPEIWAMPSALSAIENGCARDDNP
jgi:hypothetical protein